MITSAPSGTRNAQFFSARAIFCVLVSSFAWFSPYAHAQSTPVMITNVRIEVGDGTVIPRGTVLFSHGKIQSVSATTHPHAAASENITTIDGTHKVLTPGLIESHSHLGLVGVDMEKATVDAKLHHESIAPSFRASDGYHADAIRIPIARAEGITHAIMSPSGDIIFGTGAWIDLAQPSLIVAPQTHSDIAMFGSINHKAASSAGGARGGIWRAFRRLFADARFYDTHRALFARGETYPLILPPPDLDAMLPVIKGHIPFILHADRSSDIAQAITFAQREHIRIIIAGGKEAWRVAPSLARAQIPVIVRPSMQSPDSFDALSARDDLPALLHAAGVPLIISAGLVEDNTPRLRQEAGIAVAHGLPHEAALQAITQTPARIFNQATATGTLQPGKQANLVLWSGDPLEVRSTAEIVWIRGNNQPLRTRQQLLAERYLLASPQK